MPKTKTLEPTIHIHFVLDRSGSMQSIRDDVIGGFNAFLEEQKAQKGKCLLTLVQFDSQDPYEVICDAVSIDKVAPLSASTFVPRGGTPLYDAMGRAIANAVIRQDGLKAKNNAEENILFVTFTDGQENQSVEYTKEKIFQAITKRKKDGWTFVYLGANQDAYEEGGKVGYALASTANYDATSEGTRTAFNSLAASTSLYRARGGTESNSIFFDENAKETAGSSK